MSSHYSTNLQGSCYCLLNILSLSILLVAHIAEVMLHNDLHYFGSILIDKNQMPDIKIHSIVYHEDKQNYDTSNPCHSSNVEQDTHPEL